MSARRPAMLPFVPPPSGIGDLRLIGKLRVLDNEAGGFGLAFVPQIGFPTGSDTAFRGDGTLSIESRVAADYRLRSGALAGSFVALNLSYYARTYNRRSRLRPGPRHRSAALLVWRSAPAWHDG